MLSSILKSYSSLTFLRIASRILQFILKTYLIREKLDMEVVGHMVNLDIIMTLSLHFTKACLKPAYQRAIGNEPQKQAIKIGQNIMTIGVFVTLLFSIGISLIQIFNYDSIPYFKAAVILYALAAISESFQQKFNTQLMIKYQYKKSGILEMCSYIPRTGFIYLASLLGYVQIYGIAIFGASQFLYSIVFTILTFFVSTHHRLGFEKLQQGTYIFSKARPILRQLSILSIIKLLLQQFQKVVMVYVNIAAISSIYSLIANLGSIVVRFFFAPIEEICYNYFSRGDIKHSLKTLQMILQGLMVFSLVALVYGYHFSDSFLMMLYGERWTNVDSILAMRSYAVLLSLIGLNGITQSFVFAKGDPQAIRSYRLYSVISTTIYLVSSVTFLKYDFGASSIFLGGVLSMALRIYFSWRIQLHKHYDSILTFLNLIFPSIPFIGLCVVSFILAPYTKVLQGGKNMIIGVGLLGLNMIPIILQMLLSKDLRIMIKDMRKGQKIEQQEQPKEK